MNLNISGDDFIRLHDLADTRHRGRLIPVPIQDLKNLLMDHSNMYARLEYLGEDVNVKSNA